MAQEKKNRLFDEFPPVPTEEWEQKIHADLKGADYEKKLVWRTPEGIRVPPYYRAEHLEALSHTGIFPGEAPYVRGNVATGNDWVIRQDFEEADPEKANELARHALEKGAEAVGLQVSQADSPEKLRVLLKGISLERNAVHFLGGKPGAGLLDSVAAVAGTPAAKGSVAYDPLGHYLLYEKFITGEQEDLNTAADLIVKGRESLPGFDVLAVNGQYIHNAGGSAVQEIAFALAQGNEYLARLTDKGLPVEDIAARMQFTIAIGSGYFMEIAKIRALRMLWAKITGEYGPGHEWAGRMNIHAVTSTWNKSVYDPYVNMLRTTTEAMAASVGGVDSMTVNPFDSSFRKPDMFSLRMARNQQIILKHEAYFNKVADPAAGSYYIENLTDSLARAAWDLFLQTEDKGGFISAVSSGFIRTSVEDVCQKRDMDIATRKQVFVGTNLYPDTGERVLDKVEPTAQLTDLAGLRQYRGAQAFEALRMAVENHTRKGFGTPRVFLFTYGNAVMRKARAGFASNFFGVAGYEIIDNLGFPDVGSGVKAALESGAHIVVLCSSDEEYEEMAPAVKRIKEEAPDTQVVVAGNPRDLVDILKAAGVDDFIHIRTNVLESLTRYNEALGVV